MKQQTLGSKITLASYLVLLKVQSVLYVIVECHGGGRIGLVSGTTPSGYAEHPYLSRLKMTFVKLL